MAMFRPVVSKWSSRDSNRARTHSSTCVFSIHPATHSTSVRSGQSLSPDRLPLYSAVWARPYLSPEAWSNKLYSRDKNEVCDQRLCVGRITILASQRGCVFSREHVEASTVEKVQGVGGPKNS
ncbi:hypothetical protein RRG08_054435 [Elysia crispata]|uniref:Uncharacterized protein n=1 Tax=Elysia crispata TaxID=231223 RepID=A0AAE1AWU8_9GAST|nr:hypothetical protein RRG08_054435 [Elysia crispata]